MSIELNSYGNLHEFYFLLIGFYSTVDFACKTTLSWNVYQDVTLNT